MFADNLRPDVRASVYCDSVDRTLPEREEAVGRNHGLVQQTQHESTLASYQTLWGPLTHHNNTNITTTLLTSPLLTWS